MNDDEAAIYAWLLIAMVRVVITLACLFTIQTVIHWHGYWIPFHHLLLVGAATLIGIRMMSPWKD